MATFKLIPPHFVQKEYVLRSGSKQMRGLRNNKNNPIILTKEIPKHEDLDKGIKQMKDSTHRLKTDSS